MADEGQQGVPKIELTGRLGDASRADSVVYYAEHDRGLEIAVKVALLTERPLLLRGDPGSGKSSLARYLARYLGWRSYERAITSRSEAMDLLYGYDAVRRLSEAHGGVAQGAARYVEPGPLWWALDPAGAKRQAAQAKVKDPDGNPELAAARAERSRAAGVPPDGAVVLIDEIDKAEAELPNDLLVPLGSFRFDIPELSKRIELPPMRASPDAVSRVVVVVTTNEERDLPPAFLRRCAVHRLEHPDGQHLEAIATLHFGQPPAADPELYARVAQRVEALRGGRSRASTAEFLDAVQACRRMGVRTCDPNDVIWRYVEQLTLTKPGIDDR